jgi:hypothetical protein
MQSKVLVIANEAKDFSHYFRTIFHTHDTEFCCLDNTVYCHFQVMKYWSSLFAKKYRRSYRNKPIDVNMTAYQVSQMVALMCLGKLEIDASARLSFWNTFKTFMETFQLVMTVKFINLECT